ncbi:MAG: hypothetical protein ACRELX_09545, partial [Longimicrobiales bacterium]
MSARLFAPPAWSRTTSRLLLAVLFAGVAGCDFLDPTEVENPRTTEDDLARAAEPTRALLPGLRAQFARAIGAVVTVTSVVSDDYSIQGTGIDKAFDEPGLVSPGVMNGTGGTGPYWNLQELRALSGFVLDDVVPDDTTATSEQIAEAEYYRGMAYVMLAENFTGAALEIDQPVVAPPELLARGIASLEASIATSADGPFVLPGR